jgi:poly-gamma-glutamate synthesis protein (capsule biosynthesis protein)
MTKKAIILLLLLFLHDTEASTPKQDATLIAVGDIMLGRHIAKIMESHGSDFPFQRVSSTLCEADIVFGNLEAIVSAANADPAYPDKLYNFHTTADAVPALRKAGFTILTLANNHAMDYGYPAVRKTKTLLEENGIREFGAGRDLNEARHSSIIHVGNTRFGFLGYSIAHSEAVYAEKTKPGIAPVRLSDIQTDIVALRGQVDVIIVSLHWGKEYNNKPSERQRSVAHRIIDWGADLILGHHPHVMQGIEIYKGKIIAYSLGNFVFDEKRNGTGRSFMLTCKFHRNLLDSAEIVPLDRFEHYFPRIAEGQERKHIISDLATISLPLNEHADQLSTVGLIQ